MSRHTDPENKAFVHPAIPLYERAQVGEGAPFHPEMTGN